MGQSDDRPEPADAHTPRAGPAPGTAPAATAPEFRWIPIRSLAQRHRPKVLAHLLALDPQDRYLRFGYAASDTQVSRYVDLLDFDRDEVFGIFNRRLALIAQAHLAYLPDSTRLRQAAEFGVSVLPKARGRGYGARLFDHAMLHARNRGVDTMIIHALSENAAMLKIARNAGATVEREGGEAEARLRLPPETLGSVIEEMVESQAAEIDYQLKSNAQRVDQLRQLFGEIKAGIRKVRDSTIE
ncbi:MAG TPA: GNAT family N-acetyltransferase [Ideonella sp.]|uniref:GNAT family N-acetyltransferase n=1 Tax=Ideonella sp. TaxID=1929293 RepID=UPI002E34A4F7|nr:GNAT family N-acetyltransferase [Ideonella sp.]HEX5683480.1 GNAT family N-acetyltransferase [Ideonella sp.]